MLITTRQYFTSNMRRVVRVTLLAATLITTAGACRAGFNVWTSEYTFARQELQTAIATQFPHELRYLNMFDVALSNPRLSTNAQSNRVVIIVDAKISNQLLMPRPVNGTLTLSSGIRYDAAARALRLDAPTVDKIDMPGVPAQFAPQLNAIGNAASEQILKSYPIYTFKPEQLEMNGKHFEPGAITVLPDGIKIKIEIQPL